MASVDRPYSDRIVPAWLRPTTIGDVAAASRAFPEKRSFYEERETTYRTAAKQLSETSEGDFVEAAFCAHQLRAVKHGTRAEIMGHLHNMGQEIVNRGYWLNQALDEIDYETHQAIAAAPQSARESLIATGHARAVAAHEELTAAVVRLHGQAEATITPLAAGIIERTPPPADKSDTTQALDNGLEKRGEQSGSDENGAGTSQNQTAATGTSGSERSGIESRGQISGGNGASAGTDGSQGDIQSRGELAGGAIFGSSPTSPPPRTSLPTPVSGGGLAGTRGGGSVPSTSPGGLGSSGLPGVPASPLTNSLGQMPGATGGLPAAGGAPGAAGAGSPAAAFTRGVPTGAGIGGGVPAVPPAASPASPSSALTAGAPASPAAVGGGVSPVSAQSGMVTPAAPAAPAGAGGAMMLPPGSMGPPPAAPPAAAPAATVPAGTLGGSNAPPSPSSGAGGGVGPTLIPASVVAAGQAAAAQDRGESADARSAKELCWKLQHAAGRFAFTEWSVGVFRSPSGTETVIHSSDGASYIPAGVLCAPLGAGSGRRSVGG